jgi:predicted signal transduction protein with EAL and GGDEF domain
MLRTLGCSEMQGYLFSAPKPAADVKQLLLAHRQGPAAASPGRAGKPKPVARSA